ncbi:hypothetical protein M9979_11555 [Sphingomonas sp. RP10(2022)]|uniref:Uncharacterized protein n=1 Tax=Sphingomonas liriopis TaxID=2949094 RepID=A0A9X2KRD9_9SPHN|nr:hypothetical protein [Sphingomonas liriopis]MCP3735506.1 hypothetical protein [Sphingomonas liriopis]
MNDTATAGGATGASLIPSTTDAFTVAHLAIVAIFALLVIAAIVWGARLKRRRKTAERDIASHNDDVHAGTARVEPPVEARSSGPIADEPTAPAPAMREAAPVATAPIARDEAPVEAPSPAPLANEPIAASAPLDAAPAVEAVSEPAATTGDPADAPVSTLKGLGPKLATRLGELGITTVGQVAALSDDEAERLDAHLGPFAGRMGRDRWIEQARFLAAGDRAGFEAVFGRL